MCVLFRSNRWKPTPSVAKPEREQTSRTTKKGLVFFMLFFLRKSYVFQFAGKFECLSKHKTPNHFCFLPFFIFSKTIQILVSRLKSSNASLNDKEIKCWTIEVRIPDESYGFLGVFFLSWRILFLVSI